MEVTSIFRILLISSVALAIAGVAYPALGFYETTEDLEIVLGWNEYGGWPPLDVESWELATVVGAALVMIVLAAAVVAYIGAFFFKKWARTLLVITTVLAVAFTPLWGLGIWLPVELLFYQASGAFFYIALTMSFLAPLKQEFEYVNGDRPQ